MTDEVCMEPASATEALWPHQREAVDAAVKALAADERTLVVAACGTGKTRVGREVAAALAADGRVLITVPTLDLLAQTLREWRSVCGGARLGRVVAVCSAKRGGLDLAGEEVKVLSDPRELVAATAGRGRVTVLVTYHSLHILIAAHGAHGMPAWDLAVVDEAHRTAGQLGRPWTAVHNDVAVPAARRLYMTATPRIIAGHTASGDGVAGTDDERIFGAECYRLPFSTAIDLGLLADYRLVVPVVTSDEVRQLAGASRPPGIRVGSAALSARMLATQLGLLRATAEYNVSRAITFHHRVIDARWFAATLPHVLPLLDADQRPASRLVTSHVHGYQDPAERRTRIDQLRTASDDTLVVVSNARVLAEGVDVPAVDAVAFIDPRTSPIDTVQAVGRALRLGGREGKIATIVVPVICGPEQDPETALSSSAWNPTWQVVRALRAHDERIAAHLDSLRRHMGSGGRRSWTATAPPDWLHVTGSALPEGFAAAITVRAITTATSSWEEMYGAAQAYAAEHGHLDVPRFHVTDIGVRLGDWIAHQRVFYHRGELVPERRAALEALGMIWDAQEAAWQRGLAAATAFHREHGHLTVNFAYRTADDYPLGKWIGTQRQYHARGELRPARHAELDRLGMVWNARQAAWERGLAAAAAFRRAHGHLNVPHRWITADGYRLSQWLATQRGRFRAGELPPERTQALTDLGMRW